MDFRAVAWGLKEALEPCPYRILVAGHLLIILHPHSSNYLDVICGHDRMRMHDNDGGTQFFSYDDPADFERLLAAIRGSLST